ncbi:hypothetical protein [Flavobacterium sp.]|uniref:hypothetical protein n=1 Tax=Flavobacterium sp. TaxID=239 RepID=UPI0028BE5D86|nr:hypothetical protein [Flavobacterium sp.]
MKENSLANLTDEMLLKRRNLIKGALIGFGIVFTIAIGILIYLFISKGFKNTSIATLIPVFMMPVTLLPLFINFALLNKELKSRNLK